MTTLFHKPYLAKVSTKGAGGRGIKNTQKSVHGTWFMNDLLEDFPSFHYIFSSGGT